MSVQSNQAEAWSDAKLQALNAQFRNGPPEAILSWAGEHFAGQMALTCSFSGPAGMVLLDMVVRHHLPITVIFLDTGLLFPETYALAGEAIRHYGLSIEQHQPALSLEEQERQYGPALYAREPDRCCEIRKVLPLAEALRPYAAWVSGIRRTQTKLRAAAELVEWNIRHQLLKLNPLAYWDERELWAYINTYNVPYNPLLDQGYPSIGCTPCTMPASADDPRGGRWSRFAKIECGLHL